MPTGQIETAKLSLARSLVELVRDAGSIPQTFDIEYEGVDWEVVVKNEVDRRRRPSR